MLDEQIAPTPVAQLGDENDRIVFGEPSLECGCMYKWDFRIEGLEASPSASPPPASAASATQQVCKLHMSIDTGHPVIDGNSSCGGLYDIEVCDGDHLHVVIDLKLGRLRCGKAMVHLRDLPTSKAGLAVRIDYPYICRLVRGGSPVTSPAQ